MSFANSNSSFITRKAKLAALFIALHANAYANTFSNPENLKVLPKDISPGELRQTMRGFSFALGVRCQHCHEAADDLSGTPDFAADTKQAKESARAMLQLVQSINQNIAAKLPAGESPKVEVTCQTCHRGQDKPRLMQSILVNEMSTMPVPDALAKYRERRSQYYGSHTFDFSPTPAIEAATTLFLNEKKQAAEALLKLNLSYHEDHAYSQFSYGRLLLRTGQREQAVTHMQKAVALAPKNRFYQEQLQKVVNNEG